jgi:2-phosphinomethylmalic acid synthase
MRTIEDTALPNLMRHVFPTYRVPRVSFAEESLPVDVPGEVYGVDATLSQGVLALTRPGAELAGQVADLLQRLENGSGLLRKVEVRVEGSVGRDCLDLLLERHHHGGDSPLQLQPVATIPTTAAGPASVAGLGLKEAGLAIGASDFFNWSSARNEHVDGLRRVMDACLEHGITPRVDLLDVTRADLEGFVLPLTEACLDHLARQGLSQLRLRLCDSLGLGLPWGEAPLPRSVPRLIHTIRHAMGLQPSQLEFSGANDLGLALANSIAATLGGCSGIACSVGGVGERGGIAATELLMLHLSGLFGADCDLSVVSQLHALLEPLGLSLGDHHPLWGEEALTTCNLPDGQTQPKRDLLAPLDAERLMFRSPRIEVRPQTGAAGIVRLIEEHVQLERQLDIEPVREIHGWIGEQGFVEVSWEAIEPKVRELLPELFQDQQDQEQE